MTLPVRRCSASRGMRAAKRHVLPACSPVAPERRCGLLLVLAAEHAVAARTGGHHMSAAWNLVSADWTMSYL